ncbi:acetate--CoA ligase [Candidatus Marinamargulisbacteria bacterium SCGC AAA071-K20]|nr:acetate--CoA ligase [Candidatus Marinamargulisbacteria bacterium SCGC AAA071-K20]
MLDTIESLAKEEKSFTASNTFKRKANSQTQSLYSSAKTDRLSFWDNQAQNLEWFSPYTSILEWNRPFAKWFSGGTLNASVNCLDIHLKTKAQKKAIIWEGENGDIKELSYQEVFEEVNKLADILKNKFNVKKGDRVTLYMPMIPELLYALLACSRIGAIHSVVFGGFSAQSLKDRILDSQSKMVITANGGSRRGKVLNLKNIVDEALSKNDTPVENVLIVNHLPEDTCPTQKKEYDQSYNELRKSAANYVEPEHMESEDILFILYTSGTTGKPKGIVHTTGGYLTHAKYSTKTVFDLKDDDIYWCTADIGWITGHTYMVYGPMANGATVVMYEGAPDYPEKNRFWEIIEKHNVSILYTAPTAIRAFMKWGLTHIEKHNLSSLRLLGSVGEPINPEAWEWYYNHIGSKQCPIVDTWWQTETGGIMISNIPSLNDMKPGFAGLPLPGIEAKILDKDGGEVSKGGGLLSLTEPWPSMLRGIWGDNKRYKEVYWDKFNTYFAGDGAIKDKDDYIKVLGRVDDVLNVAGHRIGTMEVESALVEFEGVAEAAVVGMPDEIKGQAIVSFVILEENFKQDDDLENKLKQFVSKQIGAIAKPKQIIFTPDLPKTRSGKIMRRILKNIAANEDTGGTSTLANPAIVKSIKEQFNKLS